MIKILPYYVYQVDAIESWLDDQARQGLFLTDVRSRLTMDFENLAGNMSASLPLTWTSIAVTIPTRRS